MYAYIRYAVQNFCLNSSPPVFQAISDVFNYSECLFVLSFFFGQNSSDKLLFRYIWNVFHSHIFLLVYPWSSTKSFRILFSLSLPPLHTFSPNDIVEQFLALKTQVFGFLKTKSYHGKQQRKIPCHSLGVFLVRIGNYWLSVHKQLLSRCTYIIIPGTDDTLHSHLCKFLQYGSWIAYAFLVIRNVCFVIALAAALQHYCTQISREKNGQQQKKTATFEMLI